MTLGQGHHWVFFKKKKKELKTTWEFLCPSVSIRRVSTWCDALCWQSRLIHTCTHLQILHTHTHTRQEPSSQSALSQSLRSEGTQNKDRESSPVCAGGWIRADTWQSQERQSTARPGDLPPTSSHGLTSSTQPLTCPHHSDTLPPSPVCQEPPARAPYKLPHCRRRLCDCSFTFLWLSPDATVRGRPSLATPSL